MCSAEPFSFLFFLSIQLGTICVYTSAEMNSDTQNSCDQSQKKIKTFIGHKYIIYTLPIQLRLTYIGWYLQKSIH